MKRIVLFFTVIAALTAAFAEAAEKPLILSTIKPVHALVCVIAGDSADCEQIVPDYASPHHYSLKPSDLRRLKKADLVFRIDPNMEAQLNKSLTIIDQSKIIVLSHADGLELLDAGHEHGETAHSNKHEHEESDKHADDETHAHDSHDEHSDAAKDYHIWLDPDNAISMATAIRDALSKVMPQHEASFAENTQALADAIRQADADIAKSLNPVSGQPFLVMHDAWQYFTHHYSLNQLGSVTQQEGLKPSAKALSEARQLIRDSDVRCIVNEPGVKSRTLAVLTEDMKIKSAEIDPLGRRIALSDQTYPKLLQHTATELLNCLKAN